MNINKLRKVVNGILVAVTLLAVMLTPSALARVPDADLLAEQQEQNGCGFWTNKQTEVLQGVEIEPLTGTELKKAVKKALRSKDVRNVLKSASVQLDTRGAGAARHMLEAENTILAVGIPTEKGVVAYYKYESTERIESKAVLFQISADGETAQLIAVSVNGHSLALSGSDPLVSVNGRPLMLSGPDRSGGMVAQLNCGGCVSPITGPWEYDCRNCTNTDWNCVIAHCAACIIPCSAGLTLPCMVCLLIWCPSWVYYGCCTSWEWSCCYCGTPP